LSKNAKACRQFLQKVGATRRRRGGAIANHAAMIQLNAFSCIAGISAIFRNRSKFGRRSDDKEGR